MDNKTFMSQKASDMTVRELLTAIKIKTKQDKYFVDTMSHAMRYIEYRKALVKKPVLGSPLQNPEILDIVQKLCQIDKYYAKMRKDEMTIKPVKEKVEK